MKAGHMTNLIDIERATTTVNAAGTPDQEWQPHRRVRAERLTRTAEEFLRDAGDTTETRIVFRTRYLADLKTEDRIRFDGDIYDIEEVTVIGRRHGLEIRCISERANG